MQLRSMRLLATTRPVDGYFARAVVPLGEDQDHLVGTFIAPLHKALSRAGLGRIATFDVETAGAAETLRIDLSLVTDAPSALRRVVRMLEGLGAPTGSFIGHAECSRLIAFGPVAEIGDAPGAASSLPDLPQDRPETRLPTVLKGREPLLAEAVHRVIAAQAQVRSARDGRLN